MERSQSQSRDRLGKVSLVTIALVTAALYFGREVLIPLALAILISFILTPSVQRLQKMRLGRVPAVLLVVVLAFGGIGAVGWLMGAQIVDFAETLPRYEQNIRAKAAASARRRRLEARPGEADRRAPPGGDRHRVAERSDHAGGPAPGEVARPSHSAGAGHRRRAAGDAADGAADDAVPPPRSAGHGRPGADLRDLHADPARGSARPPAAPDRPGAAQHLDAGARRGGAAGQPLPADAEPDQRRHRDGGGDRALLHRRAERAPLGAVRRRPALHPVPRPLDRGLAADPDLAGGLPRLGEAVPDPRALPAHRADQQQRRRAAGLRLGDRHLDDRRSWSPPSSGPGSGVRSAC